jgi:hexosaminidase
MLINVLPKPQKFEHREGMKCSVNAAQCEIARDDSMSVEAYELSVSNNSVTIKASGDSGVFYARQTLCQLQDENGYVSPCFIADSPKYAHRGLSIDCARHFFSAEEVKKIVEHMALVKMNVLHWHLTDDQGWRVESKLYPKLAASSGKEFYTHEQIGEIVAFAAERHVQVIPEIELPGHVRGLLSAYPEYSCSGKPINLATMGGIYKTILCGGKESTYSFLEQLLGEITPLFPSKFFHIGSDEAPKDEWKKCPHCQKVMAKHRLSDEIQLQGLFVSRIAKILARLDKMAIVWNDSLEADNLTKNLAVQYWSIQYKDSFQRFAQNGGRFIWSDMFAFYLDYPHSMTTLKRLYNEPLTIGEVDFEDFENLMGLEAALWTEHITTTQEFEEHIFPRLYAVAERAWGGDGDYEDFERRVSIFLKRFQKAAFTPQKKWNPRGLGKLLDAGMFAKKMGAAVSKGDDRADFIPNKDFTQKFKKSFF